MGAKLTRGEDVMVSFMCQRDGTTGSPVGRLLSSSRREMMEQDGGSG